MRGMGAAPHHFNKKIRLSLDNFRQEALLAGFF
jgi:hypothetical protein